MLQRHVISGNADGDVNDAEGFDLFVNLSGEIRGNIPAKDVPEAGAGLLLLLSAASFLVRLRRVASE